MPVLRPWVVALLLLPGLVSCGLMEEIERGFQNAVDCSSCHALLPTLRTLAYFGDDAFIRTITNICNDLKIQDPDVCEGAIRDQGPILAHDLRSFSLIGQTSTKFCDAVFGLCQPPSVNEYSVPFPKPEPIEPQASKSSGRFPFQVIHFSDVHIDRQYTVGSEANCTKPMCCRNWEDDTGVIKVAAGPNGNVKCDTPAPLVDSMLKAAQHFAAAAKFAIFTGDVIEHAVWAVNETGVTNDMQAFNDDLVAKLHVPVFPALGNHESAPVNSFPRNTTTTELDAQWVFKTQSAGWTQWIGAEASSQAIFHSGCYSTVAPDLNLRVISINTQYWYKQNFWLYDSDTPQPDPNGILEFIVQELQAAEDAGQRAWIIGHSPPGKGDIMSDQSNYLDQIIQRYKHTLAGQFYGHTHRDEFAIGYSNYSNQVAENAVTLAMIGPALTPMSGHPAFKVYDVDPDTFEIMDARTYITNISDPHFQTDPTWELYYSARDTYGPLVPYLSATDTLGPAFWHNVTEVFIANDTEFHQYHVRRTRGGGRIGRCQGNCKNSTICDMRTLRAEYNCDNPSGPASRIQAVESEDSVTDDVSSHQDSCDGTGIGHILKNIVAKMSSSSYSPDDFPRSSDHLNQVVLNI